MPDVLMPRLSDTMTEGVISQWLKHEGDAVSRGEIIAEIETDKAARELEAYNDGVLTLRGTHLMVQSLCGLGLVGRGPL